MNTTFTNYAEKKAKQFLNLLQGYTKGIRITAILILLLMGVNNAWGATLRYIYVGISNNYQQYKNSDEYGFNFWGGTSGGVKSGTYLAEYTWDGRKYYMYRVQVHDDNKKAQFKGNNNWWDPGDGYSVKLNGTTNNAVFFSHSNDGWSGQFQQNYQETSTASLTASSTSVTTGTNVTLTPSLSSNATYNQIKSTTYTVSTNPGSGGSVTSAGVFSATKAGTYIVTATVTYNPKYFTGITKTATATQTIKVYDTQYVLRGSQTANGDPKGGMAGWDATNNNAYTSATINGTTMTIVATLTNAKTQYKFKIYNNFDGSYYGQTGNSEIPNNESWTLNGSNDVKFTTTAAGQYTFIYNASNKSIKVQYPTAYTVTYSRVPTAAANAPTTTPSFSSGAYVLANTSVTFTAKTANTGYTWKGWYSNNSGTSPALSSNLSYTRSITANTTIYAVYTANTYTVKFDANGGGGNMSNQNFTYGTVQNLTANAFTRTGYTFAGWATSANETKVYDDKQSVSNLSSTNDATVTLYAKWTANQYTITYKDQNNANFSGSHATGYPTQHTYGTATTLKDATKTGYTFDGWHTDAACTNKVTSLGATAYTANITLYAKWTATPTTIYLKPSANWKQANARFAIYAFGGGSEDKWVDMTPVGCNDEYYMVDVPAGYSQFKFVRLNPNADNYGWDNDVAWGQTNDLSIQNDGDNLWDMTKKMHLNIGSWSENASGRFAAYFFEQGKDGEWVSMFKGNDNNVYYCDIPNGTYTHLILCRMDPGNLTNAWNNNSVWHQTGDIPLGVDNYYTITSWGTDGKNCSADGSYIMVGEWTKLDLPKITITNSDPTYGDLTVTTVGGTTITSGTEVDWDTQVIVSVQPKAGYAVKSSSINIGGNAETIQSGKTYTICNNTTISVSFEEKGEWYIAGIDGKWDVREEYKFIDDKILIKLDGKKTKEFKVVKKTGDDTEWYGNFTFKGLYPSGVLNTNSGDYNSNCKVETVHDGDYLFVWDENSKKLTIEYPDVIFLHGSFNGWKDKASHALHDRDAKVYLEGSTNYTFKVVEKGVYWTSKAYETIITNNGTKNIDDNAAYDTDPRHNCQIQATITGLYTFHFDKETRVLTVTYPEDNSLEAGDYRLYYTETAKNHASDYVKQRATDGRDTVSLFINKDGSSPKVTLQQYNGSSWVDVNTEEVYNVIDIDAIANDEHMYHGNGVWNFIITQVGGVAKVATNETHRYTGNYYIRTEVAGGGWYEYKIPENQMFFSSYARDNENFDHYFCKYINIDESSNDVRFNVANDYCSQLCPNNFNNDNLVSGYMTASGNVRFMYFSKTNTLGRAYLDGSSTDNFLRITDATDLYDADGKNSITTAKFTDLQNWIYQIDVQATTSTQIKLRAIYNGKEQYFKGSAIPDKTVPLLASTSNDKHKIRLIYNFKTNHLVCAWLAAGETIDGNNQTLGADMMLIRKNQDPADQLYFNPNNNTLSKVKNAYAVMTFTEEFIKNEEKTIYERALYWVSFPYNVLISQVFGFGEYGEHWIMQYYDGAARAEKGLFSDSGTYWKYITNTNTILERGKGYVLTLDLDKVKTSFIHGIESVSLYFPSDGELGTIQGDDPTAVDVPEHKCNINFSNDPNGTNKDKRDRRIYDSHWNMIGVPRFADIKEFDTDIDLAPVKYSTDSLSFYYEYLPKTDKYQTRIVNADFQSMYGYMVQFAGRINWTEKEAIKPTQLAARRNTDNIEPEKVSLRLEIAQDEVMADQTFVQLQQEGATAEFDMNLDLTKIINSGANIYTLAGEQRIQSAGNALPMGEAIVPVGVKIATEGEYTFRMPDGTEGMVVELIDYERDITTNLLLFDYTVTLPAGSNESRFALHIQPNKSGVTTGVESVGDKAKGIEKYLIDGKLVIRTAEGVIYDAQGHVVQ